jgi:hypothetical protein
MTIFLLSFVRKISIHIHIFLDRMEVTFAGSHAAMQTCFARMATCAANNKMLGSNFSFWLNVHSLILRTYLWPGTDAMILKIFSPKNWRFWLETKLNYAKF